MVQHKICDLIEDPGTFLEHRFKGHIADIYWKQQNIVFEVQCSPISLEEACRRTKDFEDLGIHIIWILHQKNFNKEHMSPSEEYLVKNKTVYYTNISQASEGIIFDQEEAIIYQKRPLKSPPIEINLNNVRKRIFSRKVYFASEGTSYRLVKRIYLFPEIWKQKRAFFIERWKRKFTYYIHYIKWTINLGH